MKKLLYVAMAALVLMACNSNEPKLVGKDKKMVDKASKEIVSLIGSPKADFVKKMEKAGFVQLEAPVVPVPARLQKSNLKRAAAEDFEVLYFCYNAPEENWQGMEYSVSSEEEAMAIYAKIAKSKKVYIECTAYFEEGELLGISGNTLSGRLEKINNFYLNASTNLYNSLPEDLQWYGTTYADVDDWDSEENGQKFENKARNDFEVAISGTAEEDALFVDEQAFAHVEAIDNNVGVYLNWMNYPLEMYEAEGVEPFVIGGFSIGLD